MVREGNRGNAAHRPAARPLPLPAGERAQRRAAPRGSVRRLGERRTEDRAIGAGLVGRPCSLHNISYQTICISRLLGARLQNATSPPPIVRRPPETPDAAPRGSPTRSRGTF